MNVLALSVSTWCNTLDTSGLVKASASCTFECTHLVVAQHIFNSWITLKNSSAECRFFRKKTTRITVGSSFSTRTNKGRAPVTAPRSWHVVDYLLYMVFWMGCHTLAFRPCKHQPSENACTSAERLLRATLRKRQDFGAIVVFCPIQYWFPHICKQFVKDPNVHRMNTKEGRRQSPQRRLAHNPAPLTPQPCHCSEKVKWPKGSLRFGPHGQDGVTGWQHWTQRLSM